MPLDPEAAHLAIRADHSWRAREQVEQARAGGKQMSFDEAYRGVMAEVRGEALARLKPSQPKRRRYSVKVRVPSR